jgi:glycosyltransferase involved in cell wall biosynthesis
MPPERVVVTGLGPGLGHSERHTKAFDGRTLLYIGKGDFEKKGGVVTLAAFAKVRGTIPDATLHLVGQPRLSQALPGVVNHGFVSDRDKLRQLVQEATAFVLPSLVDRNPLTLIEAMAASTPVIASDYGAMPEIVGDAGLIVSRGEVDELARAMLVLLRDPDLARRLGENGRRRHEQVYNWDVIWQTMRAEIESVLAEGTAR